MQRWTAIITIIAPLLLAGCVSPVVHNEVTVFQDWSADLQTQPFVFERTKEQDNNLEYRAYEILVRERLKHLGFVEAAPGQSPKIKVNIGYSIRPRDVRVIQPVVVDPFWYGPPPFYSARWRNHYSPFYDPLWYGPPETEYQESRYTLYQRHLNIGISRTVDGKKLYDVTVNSEGRDGSLAAVMRYMILSAFEGFPGKNGETRRIDLKLK